MRLAATPAKTTATPERGERRDAPLGALVEVEPGAAVLETAPVATLGLVVELAVVGVNGAVTPNPGSFEAGTDAAKAAKVLLPVVGGLIAPYMPPWQ